MQGPDVVGLVLVAGLVLFLVGAAAWRLDYEQPARDALPIIHADRRRRAWIHLWMVPALFATCAGVVGLATVVDDELAVTLVAMAAGVYALGAVCWIASLAFRLTVVPWAAERTVADGHVPDGFSALDGWAGALYVIHMASAYAAFAILGAGVLADGGLARWAGWLGVGWGVGFLLAFVATRFSGPFNPPFWAHAYTGLLGVLLLMS